MSVELKPSRLIARRVAARDYYARNKLICIARVKAYQAKHPEVVAKHRAKWNNKAKTVRKTEKYKAARKMYRSQRLKLDFNYRLANNVRRRISNAIKSRGLKKHGSTFCLIGCEVTFLRAHIQSLWTDGMSWDNYGYYGWHMDHKIPLASASTPEELFALCHYTNLQPMWGKDNIKKSDKCQQS